eukprot:g7177.t1
MSHFKRDDTEKEITGHLSELNDRILKCSDPQTFDPKEFAKFVTDEPTIRSKFPKKEIDDLEKAMRQEDVSSRRQCSLCPPWCGPRRGGSKEPKEKKLPEPQPDRDIKERDGNGVLVLNDFDFHNWGRTVEISAPRKTCFPTTKVGVQNCVRWAKANERRVRAAGYRHTWSHMYCERDDVIISMVPLNVAEIIPTPNYPYNGQNELMAITEVHTGSNDPNHQLVRVGAATSNEHLRVWSMENGFRWTIPLNVVMVEITMGGSNGPICHGAGLQHKTLSDLVTEIEYVNANGDLRIVNDAELLKTAAGCFGLLGIVVSLTLRLDKMTYANMRPTIKPVVLSIPPPDDYTVPQEIDIEVTEQQKKEAWNEFVQNCEKSYYNEYFWFPLQEDCWINCWENNGNPANSVEYPNKLEANLQSIGLAILNFMNSSLFRIFPPAATTLIVGGLAMAQLQNEEYVVPVSEGIHFARGIQNLRCIDFEWEIPIPPRGDDPRKPDWSIVQKCWWDVIIAVYRRYEADKHDIPMRLTLEMRIMGGSDIIMSPQYGNDLGTLAIECLSFDEVPHDQWQQFMQETTDAWSKHTDAQGRPLEIRPHWAKQWKDLTVRGEPIMQYVKGVYSDNIKRFKADLEKIGKPDGVTLDHLHATFSNDLFDEIFFTP